MVHRDVATMFVVSPEPESKDEQEYLHLTVSEICGLGNLRNLVRRFPNRLPDLCPKPPAKLPTGRVCKDAADKEPSYPYPTVGTNLMCAAWPCPPACTQSSPRACIHPQPRSAGSTPLLTPCYLPPLRCPMT